MVSYEGEKDYIFISYSHRDEKQVMPIVEKLINDGCRVWYDEGINPGNEWPEIVASHLKECALFMAFISRDYMDSFNCKREIDYAVSQRKPFIAVYLQDVQMTPGMEMQLSSVQAILRHQMDEKQFFECLYRSDLISSSRDVEEPEDKEASSEGPDGEAPADPVQKKQKIPLIRFRRSSKKSRKLTAVKIAVIIAAVLAAVIVIRLVSANITEVNIAGTDISKSETYLTFRDTRFSPEDLKKLTMLDGLNTLNLSNCTFTDGADGLKNMSDHLSTLELDGCSGISDYSFISSMSGLQVLNIRNSDMTDADLETIDFAALTELTSVRLNGNRKITRIDPLSSIESLIVLNINDTMVSDLAPLSGLDRISTIEADNTLITDLTPLAADSGLEKLMISHCKVASLTPLRDMTKLKVLTADRNGLNDLDGLQDKGELVSLSIAENQLEDLDELESAFRLEDLIAYGNHLTSAAGLSSCTVLRNVDLHDNNLSDVNALSKSRGSLCRLDLRGNSITGLSELSGMPSLTCFYADDNQITDISFLAGAASLEILSAENNKIVSFDPIAGIATLQNIYLADNEISGAVNLEEMPSLQNVNLQHNKINSISYSSEERAEILGIPIHLSVLAAYDNPLYEIKDIYTGGEDKNGNKINEGYISFPSEEEAGSAGYSFDPYTMAGCFHKLYLADCPYDLRLKLEEVNSRIDYTDTGSMDLMMKEKKESIGFSIEVY